MARTIAASILSKLSDEVVYPFYAVDLNFDTNPVYAWTGIGTITIAGNDYIGVSNLLSVSDIQETAEIAARGATLTLSGIPSDLLSLALTEPYQGRICRLRMGFMTSWESPDSNPDTMEIFSGYMDQMIIEEGPETSTIALTIEGRLIDLERVRVRRYTKESQKIRHSGDRAFDFVESLQDQQLAWGGQVENSGGPAKKTGISVAGNFGPA